LIAQTLTLHAANAASRRNDINIPVVALLSGATKKFSRAASARQISSRSIVSFRVEFSSDLRTPARRERGSPASNARLPALSSSGRRLSA